MAGRPGRRRVKDTLVLVDMLAANPYLTTTKVAAEQLGVVFTTAQRGIRRLERLSIIREVSHGKRDRVYCPTDVMGILEGPGRVGVRGW